MKIDEAAFERAIYSCPAWRDVARALIQAYLAALPSAEPGRDRIAVSRFNAGDAVCRLLEDGEEPDWEEIESVIDWEMGRAERYIVRADCPPPKPAEPVEVEGSVEVVDTEPNGDEVRG